MSAATPYLAALDRAYERLAQADRMLSASEFWTEFETILDELIAGFPDHEAESVPVLMTYARTLGRVSERDMRGYV